METQDPVAELKAEFLKRKELNALYSLRSFARDLNLSAGQLSRILNHKRSLSPDQASRIAAALNLSKRESKGFIQKAILSAPASAKVSKALREKTKAELQRSNAQVNEMNQLTMERFKAIARWYHLPILELTYLDKFKADETWIAQQLGISVIEAKDAVKRLLDLGLLEPCPRKGLKKTNSRLFIDSHSEPEIRKFQRTMIEKSITPLDHASVEEMSRNLINSITFPTAKKHIPEIRNEILLFQRKILKLIRGDSYEEVYQLNCQLFPLTKSQKRGAV